MKYLFTILLLFSSQIFAQNYIAQWTSSVHDSYEVQQSIDNVNWKTIGNVAGINKESTYQYIVPGSGYFYRIKAGDVNSKSIYLESVILPVRLISASIRNNALTWTVGSEDNVDYYLIESSTDGTYFKEISKVQAVGNSTYKLDLK